MIEEITPQLLSVALFLLMLAAPAVTLPVSWLLLWRYRRAVIRAMSARVAQVGASSESETRAASSTLTSAVADPGVSPMLAVPADRLYRHLVRGPWHHALIHAVAGLGFGLIMTFAMFVVTSLPFRMAPVLFCVWMCSWPMVLTTNLVVAASWRMRAIITLTYFAMLAPLVLLAPLVPDQPSIALGAFDLPARSTVTPFGAASTWARLNLAPTILLLLFLNRRVRAVGPLLLSFITVALSGVILTFFAMATSKGFEIFVWMATALHVASRWSALAVMLGVMMAILGTFGVLGWLGLVWIRRAYQGKTINDQSLTLDAIWLVFGTFYSVLLVWGGLWWVSSGAVAFLAYRLVLKVGYRLVAHEETRPRTELLFLRVFSLGRRSERMFDAVAKHWRYLDTVQLIVGPDLATTTVAPHQFLEYVAGKLPRLFVSNREALEQRMKALDSKPDADGRFRVNTFFCHANTWTSVLSRLVRDSHVVLMDLRAFAPDNAGCILELKELINVVPLRQSVLVVDGTTDQSFLERTIEESWRTMDPGSPNRASAPADLQPFRLPSLGEAELRRLLRHLCAAVTLPATPRDVKNTA
jgi:hypothetical protein